MPRASDARYIAHLEAQIEALRLALEKWLQEQPSEEARYDADELGLDPEEDLDA